MDLMLLMALGIYKNIVNEHHYKPIQKLMKHPVHVVHEDGCCIPDPERHYKVLVMSIASPECGLRNICLSYSDLVVSRLKIDLRNDYSPTHNLDFPSFFFT